MILRNLFGLAAACALGAAAGCSDSAGPETHGVMPVRGRGALLSATLVRSITSSDLRQLYRTVGLSVTPRYDVDLYRIRYRTVDPHGRLTEASGAIVVPKGARGRLPLVSYQHETIVYRSGVASITGFDPVASAFASTGYVAAVPDYLGLGLSQGMHPYLHAGSLATSVVDMLRATRAFCAAHMYRLNDKLFLLGYSEGGFATMAAHRELEQKHAGEFTVTASAPMAGPYDMSGTMADLLLRDWEYPDGLNLPYLILAYNDVYHMYDSVTQIFARPYSEVLPPLFDGTRGPADVNKVMPLIPHFVLAPAFEEAFRSDSTSPFRRALALNDPFDWTPIAPMRLYHCRNDDRVPFANSMVAYRAFRDRGASSVRLIDIDSGGHGACGVPCLVLGKEWFDSLN